MTISVASLQHVNVRVGPAVEAAAKEFYGRLLGLQEMPKPEDARARGGAWYQIGNVQLHLSRDRDADNEGSKRHFCLQVDELEAARQHLASGGVEILPDEQPIEGQPRFYVRDPGGNLIEIAGPDRVTCGGGDAGMG